MAESHVVSGLVAKRSEVSGLISHYQHEIARLQGDMQHLDATIKLFDPEYDLRTIRPKQVRQSSRLFANGECHRLIVLGHAAAARADRVVMAPTALLEHLECLIVAERINLAQRQGASLGGEQEVL